MASVDIESLLQKVSEQAPCGPNLEYDPDFGELERAASGIPEQVMGDAVLPGREPEWEDVKRRAIELFARTKDLRVGVLLTRALLKIDGLGGYRDGVSVLRRLVDEWWDTVHPQLDPEDDYDPGIRVNSVYALCDRETFLRDLRDTPLVLSRTFGPVSYRDVAVATGEMPPVADVEREALSSSQIDAAFQECDGDALKEMAEIARETVSGLEILEKALTDRVGASRAADFSPAASLLRSMSRCLSTKASARGLIQPEEASVVTTTGGAEASAAVASPISTGEIRGRDDILKLLNTICVYYERHEPSSPVPLLLDRAKRLVSKTFIEILRDLTPDGLAQAELICGTGSAGSASAPSDADTG